MVAGGGEFNRFEMALGIARVHPLFELAKPVRLQLSRLDRPEPGAVFVMTETPVNSTRRCKRMTLHRALACALASVLTCGLVNSNSAWGQTSSYELIGPSLIGPNETEELGPATPVPQIQIP